MATDTSKHPIKASANPLRRLDRSWRQALLSPLVAGLGLLLLLQVAASLMLAGKGLTSTASNAPLLGVSPEQVQRIEITAEDQTLALERTANGWALPGLGGFPADRDKVEALLVSLSTLPRSLPVASSGEAQARLKVADEHPASRVKLIGREGPLAELLTGESPGFRRLYGRVPGDDNVYDVPLAGFQLATDNDDWVLRDKLQLDAAAINRISTPDWTLSRVGSDWQLQDDPRPLDQSKVETLVRRIANLSYQGVEARPSEAAPAETPVLALEVGLVDGSIQRRLIRESGDDGYLLGTDDTRWQYQLSAYDLDGILDAEPDALMQAQTADDAGTNGTAGRSAMSSADAPGAEASAAPTVSGPTATEPQALAPPQAPDTGLSAAGDSPADLAPSRTGVEDEASRSGPPVPAMPEAGSTAAPVASGRLDASGQRETAASTSSEGPANTSSSAIAADSGNAPDETRDLTEDLPTRDGEIAAGKARMSGQHTEGADLREAAETEAAATTAAAERPSTAAPPAPPQGSPPGTQPPRWPYRPYAPPPPQPPRWPTQNPPVQRQGAGWR